MKKIMLLPLAVIAAHVQALVASPVSSNVVTTTTNPVAHANNGREHLTLSANWNSAADSHGLIICRLAPDENTVAEEAVSLVLTANGTAHLLPAGAALSTNILANLAGTGVAGNYSVSCKAYAMADKTRVLGMGGEKIWDKTLDYGDFTGFAEITYCGWGMSLTAISARFSPRQHPQCHRNEHAHPSGYPLDWMHQPASCGDLRQRLIRRMESTYLCGSAKRDAGKIPRKIESSTAGRAHCLLGELQFLRNRTPLGLEQEP